MKIKKNLNLAAIVSLLTLLNFNSHAAEPLLWIDAIRNKGQIPQKSIKFKYISLMKNKFITLIAGLIISSQALALQPLGSIRSVEDYKDLPKYNNKIGDRKFYFWSHGYEKVDFNKDGILDILYIGVMKPANVKWQGENVGGICGIGEYCKGSLPPPLLFIGQQDGTYKLRQDLVVDGRSVPGLTLGRQLEVADFNKDGVYDFFIADTGFGAQQNNGGFRDSYFLSQPDGTWLESSSTHFSDPEFKTFDHGSVLADIDADGDTDIVLTSLSSTLYCWINDGYGKMKLKQCGNIGRPETPIISLASGDFNKDGYPDLVIAGSESHNRGVSIVFNDKKGEFNSGFFGSNVVDLPKDRTWESIPEVAVADLNNDGLLDVVVSRVKKLYVGTMLEVLINKGDNKFDSTKITLVEPPEGYKPNHEGNEWNLYVDTIKFIDVDKDGDLDIVPILTPPQNPKSKHLEGCVLINNNGKFELALQGDQLNPLNLIPDKMFYE